MLKIHDSWVNLLTIRLHSALLSDAYNKPVVPLAEARILAGGGVGVCEQRERHGMLGTSTVYATNCCSNANAHRAWRASNRCRPLRRRTVLWAGFAPAHKQTKQPGKRSVNVDQLFSNSTNARDLSKHTWVGVSTCPGTTSMLPYVI